MVEEGHGNGEEVEEEMNDAAKRKLTSKVWKEMKKVKIDGDWKAKKLKTRDGKILSQSSLKLSAKDDGKVGVENYTFDQEYAREQLGNMLVLHDYPLSIVDHAGFRSVHALQLLFKLHTRNTYRFIYVPAPHTADVIDEQLHESLVDWNIDEKLMTIDNCTKNDKAIELIVDNGLDVMKSAIDNIRESAAYWTATPKRVMFECAKQVDKQYVYLPDDKEWEFAMDVVDRLRLFYEITELFSGTDYVTANVYFPKICEIKMKMRQWETSSDPIIKEMTEQMNTKFDKYWKDIQGLMGIATLLDPRYKKQMLVACFAMLNGVEPGSYECIEKVDGIVASLHALLEEYEVEEDAYQPAEGTIISTTKAPVIMNIFHDIVSQQRPMATKVQGEIEQYLTDALLPYVEKFNVLDWWNVAGTRCS
ncbi:hypothetical protein ACQ4PT_054842 [Festuca glaucescens]